MWVFDSDFEIEFSDDEFNFFVLVLFNCVNGVGVGKDDYIWYVNLK